MRKSIVIISLLLINLFFIVGCAEKINDENYEPVQPLSFLESEFDLEYVNDDIWKVKLTLAPINNLDNIAIFFEFGHDLEFINGDNNIFLEKLSLEKDKEYFYEYSFRMPNEGCQRLIANVRQGYYPINSNEYNPSGNILYFKSIYVLLNDGEVNLIDAEAYHKLSPQIC